MNFDSKRITKARDRSAMAAMVDVDTFLSALDDIEALHAKYAESRARAEKAEAELADRNRVFVEMLNNLEGLVFPDSPTGWEYPSQVQRHIADEITALRARAEQAESALNEKIFGIQKFANALIEALNDKGGAS